MKNKSILTMFLASLICMSSTITTFADVTETQIVNNDSENKSPSVDVKASIKSTYEVTLPKTMTVNNGDNAYNVNVKGDLAGDEAISVVPDATVSLSSEGKDAVVGNITQEKQTFTYADASKKTNDVLTGTDAAGNISINGLTAGHWAGTFNFNVGTNKYVPMSVNLTADKTSAKVEDTIMLTANVTDGKSPYQYQFKMRKKGTDNWTNLSEYSDSNTYTWSVDKAGTFEFSVDIKDANDNVITSNLNEITTKDNIAILTEGKTYSFGGYNWTAAEVDNVNHTAVLQSQGVTAGHWPGYTMAKFGNGSIYTSNIDGQDISEYNDTTKSLYNIIKAVENTNATYGNGLYLISKDKVTSNNYILGLKAASGNANQFNISNNITWTGTFGSYNNAYAVNISGAVVQPGQNNQTWNLVIAPSFNIDLTKVKLTDSSLIIK